MKFSLTSILSGFNLAAINERLKKIEDEFNEKVLYRDNPPGTPNQMQNDLDMNGYQIINSGGLLIEGMPEPAINTPSPVGAVGSVGFSPRYAREDHVHSGMQGQPGPKGISTGLVYAYKRANSLPNTKPGDVIFDFTVGRITTPPTDDLGNGWSKKIPDGAEQLYVCVASASSSENVDPIAATEWSDPVMFAQGGINSVTVYIYQRTATNVAPTLPSQTVVYTYNPGLVANLNNGWNAKIPDVALGDYLWVSTATAASANGSDEILPAEWAVPSILGRKGDTGTPGANGGLSAAVVYAYLRSDTQPTLSPGAVTYTFADGRITSPDNLSNGWSKTIPDGTIPLWVTTASASSSFATDTIAANEWSTPVKLAANGINGLNTATVYLYRRTATEGSPAAPTGASTYTFSTSTLSPVPSGWSRTIPSDANGQYLWVTTATASSTTDTDAIASGEWATITLLAKNGTNGTNGTNGVNGSNGTRGTVTIAASTPDVVWDNTKANQAISDAGYSYPINRDIVTLYNTAQGFSQTRFYDNGSWIQLTAYIDGNMLVSGTLSANKITTGTLTGIEVNLGGGQFRIQNTGGGANPNYSTYALTFGSREATFNNAYLNAIPVKAQVVGLSKDIPTPEAILADNTGGSTTSHAVRGKAKMYVTDGSNKVAAGLVASATGFDFYAEGDGVNYGPFTGAHDCLFKNGTVVVPGDILVDVKCVNRTTLSNTIFEVARSTQPNQKAAVGVFAQKTGSLYDFSPAALPKGSVVHNQVAADYQLGAMNAVGEGQINVCGENGNIAAGDLIVTSSVPGKGMKQADDVVRAYTVARAREAVVFSNPSEQKQIACIYLCG